MRWYLGTHEPTWLNRSHCPLFVSAVRLRERCKRKLPRATAPWALDSGGFSVLNKHGRYPTTNAEYAAEVRRWRDGIGNLEWAAVQDWMCEPVVLRKTGLTVADHQRLTVASWVELKAIAPDLPWVPVLQGFTADEYRRCVELYAAAGTDLRECPLVGIGSVCRREDTTEAEAIIRELAGRGLKLHGFGFKTGGLERVADCLTSADSLAWSDGVRRRAHAERLAAAAADRQPGLFGADAPTYRTRSPQNDPRVALEYLRTMRHRAGVTEEPTDTRYVCPECDGTDIHPGGFSSSLEYTCVDCGCSFAHVLQPSLLDG